MTDPMDEPPPTEAAAILPRPGGASIAYRKCSGRSPGVIFMGGFNSDMTGTKASALEAACREAGRAYVRFDYSGHGESSGEFADGTIGSWSEDAIAVLDAASEGPQVLVGSSMGGWIMLLAALARPQRVAGLVGIASAPDFTEELMWRRFDDDVRRRLEDTGVYHRPSEYGDDPYPITMKLIEDGRRHLLLERPIAIHCPVRLLHGMKDEDVPWTTAPRIAEKLLADDVRVLVIKDGDHRLSRDQDILRLCVTVEELCREVE
jgi:pimeloyl-ACP methyl ester carboxylesterase